MMELNHFGWPMLLKAAQEFGWIPSGTLPPERNPEESGFNAQDYCIEDGRLIGAEDSTALADAMEKAAQAVSAVDQDDAEPGAEIGIESLIRQMGIVPLHTILAMTPRRWLQSQSPETIAECIALFRGGNTTIR